MTPRQTAVSAAKMSDRDPSAQKVNEDKDGQQESATALLNAIEIHTEAIANLLRSCGSSQ